MLKETLFKRLALFLAELITSFLSLEKECEMSATNIKGRIAQRFDDNSPVNDGRNTFYGLQELLFLSFDSHPLVCGE